MKEEEWEGKQAAVLREGEDGVGRKGRRAGVRRSSGDMEAGEIQDRHRNDRNAAHAETTDRHKWNGTTEEPGVTRQLPLLQFRGY